MSNLTKGRELTESEVAIVASLEPIGSALQSIRVNAAGTALEYFTGGGTWGSITGTLSDQTDLQTELDTKLDLTGGIMTGDILMTSNKLIGGSTTTSDLYLQTTTGVGTTGADMHFLVGNNGATEAMTILNSGNVGIGTTSPTVKLHVIGRVNITDAYDNVLIGPEAGNNTMTGSRGIAIGYNALVANTTGYTNIAIGQLSLAHNTVGERNTAIGAYALSENISGNYNTAIGVHTISLNVTNSYNTALGYNALYKTTANSNTAIGYNSLQLTTTGGGNVAVGSNSGVSNTTGTENIAIGAGALFSNTIGKYNVAIGTDTWTGISGDYNVVIGRRASYGAGGNNVSEIDEQMVLIGGLTSRDVSIAKTTKISNSIAIGYNAKVATSNTVVLGNSSIVTTQLRGNVGIGKTAPTAVLHLKAGTATANTAPLKFSSGTLLTTAEAGAVEFLTDAWYGTITTGAARKTFAFLESPTFTGTVTIPTPFTLGAISVTTTGTQLNYLASATGTTGTTSTNLVFSTSPTLVTPALGTPSAGVLTNCTGLPVAGGGTGLSAISALSILVANSVNTFVELTPGAGNSIRINAGGTAWEAFTPDASGANTALSNLASVAINTTLVSDTDNTDALGTSAIAWSDLFLGSGGVITFNSAPSTPDITITHSADTLTFAGGTIVLGVASATTYNGLTITANGTNTLSIAAGKTFTASNTLTLTATDGSTLAIGTGGTLGTGAYATIANYALVGQTFYIGTTQVAINRASAALTLAGITLTTPDIGTPSAGVATNITGLVPGNLVAGTLAAKINLGEGADTATIGLEMDSSLSADERYSGVTVPGTAGATIAFGDICYLDVTAGEWLLADASVVGTAGNVILGICVDASTDGAATSMLLIGTVRSAAFPGSIALGAPLYVSETAGDITATAPTTTDSVMRRVGFAVTTEPNTIYFNPSNDYVTHT